MALLEFLAAAAWARVVAADIFQGVAHRLLVSVVAMRTVNMAVVVIVVIMIVVAVRAMDMGLLGHRGCSGIKSAGIISPLRARCTSWPMNNPVSSNPSRR
ncbi:repressor protein c2 [Pseudomonas chlororaphis subsp. aurantiaca]|nr:repressor protein c2 [Pseudomonas chlororaphis subsp. aurantiaca]